MVSMSEYNDVIQKLSDEESLELLSTKTFGRLVVRRKDDMDLFPLNYVVHEGAIYFRTAEGSKLAGITVHPDVVFQVDHIEGDDAWSIVVRGTARRLDSFAEINRAEELGLKPWIPTLKYNFVEITPEKISGRGFTFGEEPERYTGY